MKKSIIVLFILSLYVGLETLSAQENRLVEIWQTDAVFQTPESVVYDQKRQLLYIGNFNDKGGFRNKLDTLKDEFISKVDINGKLLKLKWIDQLQGPTGLAIHNDKLYVVERKALACIDLKNEMLEFRVPIEDAIFLNDVVVNKKGIIFISDSAGNRIYRYAKGKLEEWLKDPFLLKGVNGLYIDGNNLIAGTRGDNGLISIHMRSKKINVLFPESLGGIDGIVKLENDFIISWLSSIRKLDSKGKLINLWNGSSPREWCADFCYIKELNLLVGPTFSTNSIKAFKL
jgi:hypothetical protein